MGGAFLIVLFFLFFNKITHRMTIQTEDICSNYLDQTSLISVSLFDFLFANPAKV